MAVAATVAALLGRRWSIEPVDAYGELGAEWIEHFDRLHVLQIWRWNRGHPIDFLVAADGAYPPLLHILTLPFGALTGHAAHDVVWTGLLWWLLLATGVALAARGLLPEERLAAPAAATAALLVPAAHGAAVRYYYDLPLTALMWLSVGLALGPGRRWPIRAGIAAGVAAGAAALVKWSAIPLVLPMLAGALVCLRPDKRRIAALSAAIAIGAAVPTGAFLAASTRSWTEMMHTFGPEDDPGAAVGIAARRALSAQPLLQAPDRSERPGGRVERTAWYLRAIVLNVLAPAGALLVVGLAVPWVRRGAPGAWLVGAVVVGHVGFVALAVPPLDERFVLATGPALALGAALGWTTLEGRFRLAVGAVAVAVGLGLAVDLHTGDASEVDPRSTVSADEPIRWLGPTSSWERRGWGRFDRRRPSRAAFRDALWAAVEPAEAERIGLIGGPIIDPFGDAWWWRYRVRLAEVEGTRGLSGPLDVVDLCEAGPPPEVGAVVASDGRITPIDEPWCDAPGTWAPGVRVPARGTAIGAVVWRPAADSPDDGSPPPPRAPPGPP